METNPWQIPYPMENWKMRYMVVWIQNHDKFIVLIWKTLDMRFGCKIRINSLHSITTIIGNIHFYFDLTKGYFQYGRTDSGAENYWSCNRETPKGAWTFGVLSVTSIWIKDITLLKKKKIIGYCEVKHIMMLLIKTITSVWNVLIYVITVIIIITAHPMDSK